MSSLQDPNQPPQAPSPWDVPPAQDSTIGINHQVSHLLILGNTMRNTKGWMSFLGLHFQWSEFTKIAVVFMLATSLPAPGSLSISMCPPGADRAPYFAAFEAPSWR